MFRAPFSFDGRIRRTEYVLSLAIYYAYYLVAAVLYALNDLFGFLFIGIVGAIWFLLAQGTKRCHDRGNSGLYQIIPLYGLIMMFGDSDYGFNEYGPNPKDQGNISIDEVGEHLM